MVKIKRNIVIYVLVVVMLFSGCASYTPLLSVSDSLEDGVGYLYGNFELTSFNDALFAENNSIGIVLENTDTKERYSFAFDGPDNELQIIEVEPGNYSLKGIEYLSDTDFGYIASDMEDFDLDWYNKEFIVNPNTAVYLGNFRGSSTTTYISSNMSNTSWSLMVPFDNFEVTTEKLKESYPNFVEKNIMFVSNITMPEAEKPTIDLQGIMDPESFRKLMDMVNSNETGDNEQSNQAPALTPEQQAELEAMFNAAREGLN